MNKPCLYCGSDNIEHITFQEIKKFKAVHKCNNCCMWYADTYEHNFTKADAEHFLDYLKNNDINKYEKIHSRICQKQISDFTVN